jgi:hypothetical protein
VSALGRLAEVRHWSPVVLGLRAVLVVAGAVALSVAWGGGLTPLLVVLGAGGVLAAALHPGGLGPAVVLGTVALAWATDSGLADAPVGGTLLIAVALAVHHQAAALAAALPPTARVERAVLVRFGRHGALVLALSAPVALLALAVARPGGSVPLELLGLAAAVTAAAVPVLLGRGTPR